MSQGKQEERRENCISPSHLPIAQVGKRVGRGLSSLNGKERRELGVACLERQQADLPIQVGKDGVSVACLAK